MFTQFGPVLEIGAVRTYRLRGQAWVTFGDAATATAALRGMQGFPFYDKQLKVGFARSPSDCPQPIKCEMARALAFLDGGAGTGRHLYAAAGERGRGE